MRAVVLHHAALGVFSSVARPFTHHSRPQNPERILLLRLERIGDLLMTLPAIRDVRALAPTAEIDLVVLLHHAHTMLVLRKSEMIVGDIADQERVREAREHAAEPGRTVRGGRFRPRRRAS